MSSKPLVQKISTFDDPTRRAQTSTSLQFADPQEDSTIRNPNPASDRPLQFAPNAECRADSTLPGLCPLSIAAGRIPANSGQFHHRAFFFTLVGRLGRLGPPLYSLPILNLALTPGMCNLPIQLLLPQAFRSRKMGRLWIGQRSERCRRQWWGRSWAVF
jgi:hypothetical protein